MLGSPRLSLAVLLTTSLFLCSSAFAQDPIGTLEGQISDPSSAAVSGADVTVKNAQTGLSRTVQSARDGNYHFSNLPVGEYSLTVNAKGFTAFSVSGIRIDIGRTITYPAKLEVAGGHASVDVVAQTAMVDTSQSIGVVVSGAQTQDLPLNGRDLTQLGLLQPGVAPMTEGLAKAGGIARSGQAFAVNGQRPESNNYLLDGASNVDSVNGGYALRVPVDAVSEFRILTLNAPAEYGGTSGATTSVVTRSGGNTLHGNAYDFLRNDALDARNFFAATTEPLHRNQYGATLGGPLRRDKDFFFAYYEGQRDSEGKTQAAIVPTLQERTGDFSDLKDPATGQPAPLINYFAGRPYPNNMIPQSQLSPIALSAAQLYPAPNLGSNVFESTQTGTTDYDQGGFRLDHYFGDGRDQTFLRYSSSSLNNFDPLPISGAGVPGFPVVNDIVTNAITLSDVHLTSSRTIQTFRASFLRNVFKKDQATNHTPGSALGFAYQPTLGLNQGTPYLIVSGYASLGNPITGPQNTWQNGYQGSYSIAMTRGRHNVKVGTELERQQINVIYGIATNGFFVFAPFPVSDSFGSFMTGQSVQFFQGGGQFDRGLRKWITSVYAQDEWRVRSNLTLNYGLRYEVNTPYTEIRNRLNAFEPGQQSKIYPNAPAGLLFPGDSGVPAGIAPVDYKQFMPRIGLTWDPSGEGKTAIRAGYGIFYDGFTNGPGGPLQAAVSALPWTQAYQLPGPGFNIANPYGGGPTPFGDKTFVAPATVLTAQSGMKPPYSQNWNFVVERTIAKDYLLDLRYVGNKGTHLPRFIEANPTVLGPGVNSNNISQSLRYTTCAAGVCNYGSVGLLADNSSSTYHAFQAAFSRQFATGLHFTASYWYSKSLDGISTLNVAGSAPSLVAGENDLAQNPDNLAAEHGPSLFDARQRFVLSGSYPFPELKNASKALKAVANGWQINTIATFSSGTPFTVYDSANVSLQNSAPEITGFYSSRPDLVADPNSNQPHTADQWVTRAPFHQLNPTTQAGQFGNEGRNVVRGPGIQNVDFSVFRNFSMGESRRLQFRAEWFNLLNHANFGLPENDLQSPAFGQILQAAPPRLLQLALKFVF